MGSISGGRGQGELEAPVWGCWRLWDETQGVIKGRGGKESGGKEIERRDEGRVEGSIVCMEPQMHTHTHVHTHTHAHTHMPPHNVPPTHLPLVVLPDRP